MRTTRLALTAIAAVAIAALAAGCSSQAARGDAAGGRTSSPTATATTKVLGQTGGLSVSIVLATPRKSIVIGSGQFTEPLSAGRCGISAGGTLAGPAEGDLGDWIAFPAGTGRPGSSYPPRRGIDRTAFQPCIPNFYL